MVDNNKLRQKINILQKNIKFLDSLRQMSVDDFCGRSPQLSFCYPYSAHIGGSND